MSRIVNVAHIVRDILPTFSTSFSTEKPDVPVELFLDNMSIYWVDMNAEVQTELPDWISAFHAILS